MEVSKLQVKTICKIESATGNCDMLCHRLASYKKNYQEILKKQKLSRFGFEGIALQIAIKFLETFFTDKRYGNWT